MGVVISDSGSVKEDVKRYLANKRANVIIKYSNFCRVNRDAPLSAKLEVLDKCVSSSLLYSSETLGNNLHDIDYI